MAGTTDFSKYDWILDLGTTSHICTVREAFVNYTELRDTSIQGERFWHLLRNVLHVPEAPNCLLSISRLDKGGGHVDFNKGTCTLKDKNGRIISEGKLTHQLYLLTGRAELPGKERANIATAAELSWDQWH
ncbi:hypothetical protein AMATHDRAFT_155082, partial [Amanita thiersii Skay4041]